MSILAPVAMRFPDTASIIAPVETRLAVLAEIFEVFVTTVPDRVSILAQVATRLLVLDEMFEVFVVTIPDKSTT